MTSFVVNEELVEKVIRESVRVPPLTPGECPPFKRDDLLVTADFKFDSEEGWVKSLKDYFEEFNKSKRYESFIFCNKYHRFTHDGVNGTFDKTMNSLGLEYSGAAFIQGRCYVLWKVK